MKPKKQLLKLTMFKSEVGYEVHLTLLDEKICTTISAMSVWERWIPESSTDKLDGRLKELRAAYNRLKLRKAEFAI